MSVTFGFYNSVNHDRKYDSEQIARIFDGVITDGVYHSVGEAFSVTAGTGMAVNVASGRAWLNHTWTYNDSTIVVPVTTAHQVYSRIDAVVIRVDKTNRTNSILMKDGASASSPVRPTMENSATVKEVPLAYVTVAPSSTSIESKNIAYVVGTSECPFVAGVQNGVNIDALVKNWENQFDVLFAKLEAQITQAISSTLIDGSVSFEKLAPGAISPTFKDVTVSPEQFEEYETYADYGYGYRAAVPLVAVDETMIPEVTFGLDMMDDVDLASVSEAYGDEDAYDGGVYIYASGKPSKTHNIPTIICWRTQKSESDIGGGTFAVESVGDALVITTNAINGGRGDGIVIGG